jgi:hypothetical protein
MAYAMGYRSFAAPRLDYSHKSKPPILIFGFEQTRSTISPKMVDRTEWIKRQFSFELPLGMYGNVVERVRGTPARLEDLTRGLSREILTRRDGNKWSMQEQAGHLLDLEPLGMTRLDDFEAGRDPLTAADMTNRKTHEANHNANTIENILCRLSPGREWISCDGLMPTMKDSCNAPPCIRAFRLKFA